MRRTGRRVDDEILTHISFANITFIVAIEAAGHITDACLAVDGGPVSAENADRTKEFIMQSIIGSSLAAIIGIAVVLMGSSFFWAPQGAVNFGIPHTPSQDPVLHAWLHVKGVRDMATGVCIFILLAAGTPALLGGLMLALALIPIGDAAIVLRSKGPKSAAYGIHAASAAVVLTVATLLLTA
ncbi:DUF4267 domain-containing protein [Nocardia australiensis]|uniref:DUF4267 domain-containing protein n=1 Tax=Nocardia australiensis TaxID=2887191 RepID=UPI001D146A84|nr:DUF4267 domain-containing protein [Nocardia australiensis]